MSSWPVDEEDRPEPDGWQPLMHAGHSRDECIQRWMAASETCIVLWRQSPEALALPAEVREAATVHMRRIARERAEAGVDRWRADMKASALPGGAIGANLQDFD